MRGITEVPRDTVPTAGKINNSYFILAAGAVGARDLHVGTLGKAPPIQLWALHGSFPK